MVLAPHHPDPFASSQSLQYRYPSNQPRDIRVAEDFPTFPLPPPSYPTAHALQRRHPTGMHVEDFSTFPVPPRSFPAAPISFFDDDDEDDVEQWHDHYKDITVESVEQNSTRWSPAAGRDHSLLMASQRSRSSSRSTIRPRRRSTSSSRTIHPNLPAPAPTFPQEPSVPSGGIGPQTVVTLQLRGGSLELTSSDILTLWRLAAQRTWSVANYALLFRGWDDMPQRWPASDMDGAQSLVLFHRRQGGEIVYLPVYCYATLFRSDWTKFKPVFSEMRVRENTLFSAVALTLSGVLSRP